ncbi:alpha-L-fucosidase [candidate division KSB1 bacterium]|nr:alpha-L-fucosidase [candidate division KSB1 bacterium]
MNNLLLYFCLSIALIPLLMCAEKPGRGKWFNEAKYGVFVHFLGGGADWNRKVDSFNVASFVRQLEQTGADYLIFTLGQNSGYYCSPNATYEQYAGYKAGERCSKRDLPLELAAALSQKGIKLMLYLPSHSPQTDHKAMTGLSDVDQMQPAPQQFTRKWSDVIREWSLRYGSKVAGWWFDGAYNTAGWDDLNQAYNWETWADACRAGNPESILAFNPGVENAFQKLCPQQDYTSGERNDFDSLPATSSEADLQWHVLSYLGTWWCKADGPRHSDQWMIDYIQKVNEQGGVVSIDVHVDEYGAIYPPHLQQLIAIAKALR